MPQDAHQRAAEFHDLAAHAHRMAAAHHGKEDHQTGREHSRQALEHATKAFHYSEEAHQKSEKAAGKLGTNTWWRPAFASFDHSGAVGWALKRSPDPYSGFKGKVFCLFHLPVLGFLSW